MNHYLICSQWLIAFCLLLQSTIMEESLFWSFKKEPIRTSQTHREAYDLLLIHRKIREESKRVRCEPMYENQRDSLKIFYELPHSSRLGYFYFYFTRQVPISGQVFEDVIPAEYLKGVKEFNPDKKKNYRFLSSSTIQPHNCRQLKLRIATSNNSVDRELLLQAKDSLDLFSLSDFRKDSEDLYITTDPID